MSIESRTYSLALMRLGAIGEAVSLLPSIKNITTEVPEEQILILCEDLVYEIVSRDFPGIDHISADRIYSNRSWSELFSPGFLTQATKFATKVNRISVDKFICFHSVEYWSNWIKPYLIEKIISCSESIGFDDWCLPKWDNSVSPRNMCWEHQYKKNLRLIKSAGIPVNTTRPWIGVNSNRTERVKMKFQNSKNLNLKNPLFTICPGAADPWRCWPVKKYVNLINKITDQFDHNILLIGTNHEFSTCKKIKTQSESSNIVNAAGFTSLTELPEVINFSNVFLANDTGPLHMAVAREIPTVGLFGPGVLYAWASYDFEWFEPIYVKIEDDPYLKTYRDDPEILRKIDVESVTQPVVNFLEKDLNRN